jgi:hypothetical protein
MSKEEKTVKAGGWSISGTEEGQGQRAWRSHFQLLEFITKGIRNSSVYGSGLWSRRNSQGRYEMSTGVPVREGVPASLGEQSQE